MTLGQIFILNRALDGKDIYSMPTFTSLKMSEISVSMYKDSLVEKGMLETHSSFTPEGLKTTKLIFDFKNAKKYISILDMVFGLIDDETAVLLECAGGDYAFTLVDTKDAVEQLSGAYSFLLIDGDNWEYGMPLAAEEFLQTYKLDSKNSFNLVTEKEGKATKEIVFTYGKGVFVYDCDEKMLYQKGKGSMKEMLLERMDA